MLLANISQIAPFPVTALEGRQSKADNTLILDDYFAPRRQGPQEPGDQEDLSLLQQFSKPARKEGRYGDSSTNIIKEESSCHNVSSFSRRQLHKPQQDQYQ